MKDGTQFFSDQLDVYQTYLRRTDLKLKTAKVISKAISNLFDYSKPLRMICIGGGRGDADLDIAALLPKYHFEVENIDPSATMCDQFVKTASLLKNVKLIRTRCARFEDTKTKNYTADLVLCINSIYFIHGWRSPSRTNPILKLYSCLKPNGLTVIVLKSHLSDHFQVKKLAGAGHTCGVDVRKALTLLKIPHYWETVSASIDVSDCFSKNKFIPNETGKKLLQFLSKGRWQKFSRQKQTAIGKLIQTLAVQRRNKLFLNSSYEIIWLRKPSRQTLASPSPDPFYRKQTEKLGQEIRPLIQVIPHFPKKGIFFRDTSKLLRDHKALSEVIKYAVNTYQKLKIDSVVAKDMQGILWAALVAKELGAKIVPTFRKDVVPPVLTTTYSHEYNPKRVLNLQKQALKPTDRVLIVDYMIATGATVLNIAKLVEHLGGEIAGVFSLMELEYLRPRQVLWKYPIHTVIKYETKEQS